MANEDKMIELTKDLQKQVISRDSEGREKFEMRKLLRKVKDNSSIGMSNKDKFEEIEPNFNTCTNYNPCPICGKCMNKASHLYVKCSNCLIPTCLHNFENKNLMLKRKNFTVNVSDDTWNKIKEEVKKQGGNINV